MKIKEVFEVVGNGVMYVLTFTQANEMFETISLILSIVISLLIIASKFIEWVRKAKADGKIDKEEIEELVGIVEELKGELDNIKEKKDELQGTSGSPQGEIYE